MIVKRLRLKNYRKFKEVQFSFKPGINLIVGLNGSGKTTIVQAIGFAIYGETLTGLNLRYNLHYDQNRLSDSGYVNLCLSNSEEVEVTREIKLTQNIATQKTVLNGKEVTVSNINKMKKMFPDKELFYELAFIDQLRHDLLDVNRQDFRQLLSRYLSVWDIQHVLDSSKSFYVYLRSREGMYTEKVSETEKKLSKYGSLEEEIEKLRQRKDRLATNLKMTQKAIAKLEDSRVSEDVDEEKVIDLLGRLQRNLEQTQRLARRLKEDEGIYEELYSRLTTNEGLLANYLRHYVDKTNFFYKGAQELADLLNKLIKLEKNLIKEKQRKKKDLLAKLDSENERRAMLIVDLEQVSQKLVNYEKQMAEQKQTLLLLKEYKESLEKYETACKIEERLESLIVSLWRKNLSLFFQKIGDRVNKYLADLDINMGLVIEEDAMKAVIETEEMDFDLLSGGERGILNLLIRIAALQELSENSILILEHPAAFLDKERTLKFLTFLHSLQKDFAQIIITTVRENLPIMADNKIVLTLKE